MNILLGMDSISDHLNEADSLNRSVREEYLSMMQKHELFRAAIKGALDQRQELGDEAVVRMIRLLLEKEK